MIVITQIANAKSKHLYLFKQIADLRGARFSSARAKRVFLHLKIRGKGNLC
jgi:hypothetical protein